MRISRSIYILLAIATVLLPLLATHADAQIPLRGVIRLAGEFGGDEVVQFEYTDGSTPEVTAGGGLLFTVGGTAGLFARGGHGLDAQASVGVKYRTIPPANNQDAKWIRFPVEALLFYRIPAGVRIGVGTTVHLANELSASGAVLNDRVEFENNPGFLVQAEYVRKSWAFDARYTALEYEIADEDFEPIDASSIGLGVSYFFGSSPRSR